MRLFFGLLYNQLAWSYDLVACLVSFGQWRAWGRAALGHLRGNRILELGHGPGHLLLALSDKGFAPVGVDLSQAMVQQARRRVRRAHACVPLVRASTQMLPFSANAFDSIVATFPTDFVCDPKTLAQVKHVLAPGGRLVVAASVRFEGTGLTSRFLAWLYYVTGQSEPSPESFGAWLEHASLSSRIVWEKVGDASVMVVIAENT